MRVVPLELKTANSFVADLHRHHKPVAGHRFSIGAMHWEKGLVGVAICGRPVARALDPLKYLEVTRLCTDGTPNACSTLYAAAARIARELGYAFIQTYTLVSEPGTSLVASGWTCEGQVRRDGEGWTNRPGRKDGTEQPSTPKLRWRKLLNLDNV